MELLIKEKKSTICLNMIVKNESHIIESTLEKLFKKIRIDYWVISDTGSTDNTKEIINSFFKKKNIPGELVEHEWKDFGYNRSKALECAYNKTDYVLIFDADDELCGNFVLPTNMNMDGYRFNFGSENGVSYVRVLLVNNRKRWCYKCVLHEYIECLDPVCKYETINGNYYVVSGRSGARNQDPQKYYKDALILEKAHAKALEEKDDLYIRYAFYCANSYMDCHHYNEAIEWYKTTLKQPNWLQEKYVSCLRLNECYEKLKQEESGIFYLVESRKYDKTRVEGFFQLIKYYCVAGMIDIAYLYYSLIKNWYETEFLNTVDFSSYLFLSVSVYNFYLAYYMIIVYCRLDRHEEGLVMFEIISNKKYIECGEWFINNVFHNFRLYIPAFLKNNWSNSKKITFLSNLLNYIELSQEKNIIIKEEYIEAIHELINKFKPVLTTYKSCSQLKSKKNDVKIFLSITTCKRLDLFKQTMNSVLNTWLDINKVDYFFCVDDNSSEKDQEYMKDKYSFFKFYLKTNEERGHRTSMNIIWKKINKLKPKYWIHLEDDWLFFKEDNYVQRSVDILEKYASNNIHQILFNRNYAELYSGWNINGGKLLGNGVLKHEKRDDVVGRNCAYWPHYSFRPSMVNVKVILELGNFNTPNNFFERDYADKYYEKGYLSAFFNGICSQHIGKLTSDKTGTNAYTLNQLEQFNSNKENTEKKNDNFNVHRESTVVQESTVVHTVEVLEPTVVQVVDEPTVEVDAVETPIPIKQDKIRIINLKRRQDRKEKTKNLLKNNNLTNYEFIEAVDGLTLTPTTEIYNLFKNNDFGNRRGFIGCAMSHYNLWKQLANSEEDYYIIFEDDNSSLDVNISSKLSDITSQIMENKSKYDIIYLGYSVFPNYEKEKYEKIANYEMTIISLKKNQYMGGFFGYIICKSGAEKMINYVNQNGIKHGIDYLIKINPEMNSYNIQPHIVYSEVVTPNTKNQDTDIQNDLVGLHFVNKDDWIFYPMLDSGGDDIEFIGRKPVESLMEHAEGKKNCVAFNTLGFFKSKLNVFERTGFLKPGDGIYVRKSSIPDTIVVTEKNVQKDYIRVKMMCNWCSSKQLCIEWNKMTHGNFIWNKIQFTWENENIDYYIIINKPPSNEYYDKSKTIIFHMEPWCYGSQTWGIKTWGEWATPSETEFLQVRNHRKYYNNGFWQLKSTYTELKNKEDVLKFDHNIISTICSSKYFDPGHIKRIDFLKYMQDQNDPSVSFHYYNEDNKFNFKNYMGTARPDIDKENGIMKYKYYFMCENNEETNFITEKLWEPLLCDCLCFYWGCPNVADYINPLAYVQLDMNDFNKSFNIIKNAIQSNLWETRLPIIRQERLRVLDYYGFCPTVERIIKDYTTPVKNVCFIHSCTLPNHGTSSLDNLLTNLKKSGLWDKLDTIYINNIGFSLDLAKYSVSGKVMVINCSNDTSLFEIPTLKLMHSFCKEQPENTNILYLHTKGITYPIGTPIYDNVQDWINYMLHFLVNKHESCIKMLKEYDTVGVNFLENPNHHWSGNYWWSLSSHISKLDVNKLVHKHDAEWWCLSIPNIKLFELHNSMIDHYKGPYKSDKYKF